MQGDVSVIRTALEEAVGEDILVVYSAGNTDNNQPHYPSDYSARPGALGNGVLSVAATDQDDRKASYSNYSPKVDVCAPGGDGLPLDAGDILSADQNNSLQFAAGTSLAVPHVVGLAALILSLAPETPVAELKRLIKETADNIGSLNPGYQGQLGQGRVNAARALAALNVAPPPTEAPAVGQNADVLDELARCSQVLKAATGWEIAVAKIVKGGQTATWRLAGKDTEESTHGGSCTGHVSDSSEGASSVPAARKRAAAPRGRRKR